MITDRQRIQSLLRKDPIRAAYAVATSPSSAFHYCSGHGCGDAFALAFRRYETPISWASGEGRDLARVLEEIGDEPKLDLQVCEESLSVLEERYKWGSRMAAAGIPQW